MKQIKNKAEYRAAIKTVEEMMMFDRGSKKLADIVSRIEAYEKEHYPISMPNP